MAIGDLCPSLNEASFGYRKVDADDLVSPNEAQTILNKWPKVHIRPNNSEFII